MAYCSFEIGSVSLPTLLFWKTVLANFDPLNFYVNFRISMLIFAPPPKKNSWNFDRDYTECVGLKVLFCVFALGTEMVSWESAFLVLPVNEVIIALSPERKGERFM